MTHVSIIGLDLAKSVFQAHGADATGAAVLRKKLRRDQVLAFLTAQAPCVVAMEACPGAHHWGREIAKLGHTVKLIAPAYVKPFVKRQKNDAADAEAICEAAQRPTMRFVAVKSEAKQASAAVFRSRDILVGQRTQVINAIRGHLAEYGLVAPQGPSHVEQLIAQIEDPNSTVPLAARDLSEGPGRNTSPSADAGRGLGCRDFRPGQGRCDSAAADERARDRSVDRDGDRGAGSPAGDIQLWTGLCGLGGADAGSKIDGRQGAARAHIAHGRTNLASPPDHRRERRCKVGPAQGCRADLMAQPHAVAQAADAGHRGASQQDSADRMGAADEQRGLPGSGRHRVNGAIAKLLVV